MRVTRIINFLGGPRCGKSTLAAESYALMKKQGLNVELVQEYVKSWAWEDRKITKFDELYIFGKQLHEESILYGKVDYIVTDRPLAMSAVYGEFYAKSSFMSTIYENVRRMQMSEKVFNIDLIVTRKHEYDTRGRFEDEDSAKKVDAITLKMFPYAKQVSSVEDVMQAVKNFSEVQS